MIGYYNYTVVLTYLSLASGMFGILQAAKGQPTTAIICLMISGLCDMFDGQVARTRKRTESEKKFGIQIDSLADLVCFGVLPAVIGFTIGMNTWYYEFILLLFPMAALIRLAYFNVSEEERQKSSAEKRKHYEGLPVTNAAIIFPFVFCFRRFAGEYFTFVFAIALLLTGAFFIIRFHIKKPGLKGMLFFVALGAVLLLFVLRSF